MATKYALVLSGGGFKGAFQVGALDYLDKNWKRLTDSDEPMKFDIITGVSVGSLNGAMVAMNQLAELKKVWDDIGKNGVSEFYTSDFIDTDPANTSIRFKMNLDTLQQRFLPNVNFNFKFFQLFNIKKAINSKVTEIENDLKNSFRNFKALADNTPLRNKLVKYLKRDQFTCPFYCGFVDLDEGEYQSVLYSDFTTDEDFINGVLGSTTMPIVWPPVPEINYVSKQKRNVIDGGVRNNSPLGDVIKFIQEPNNSASEYLIIVINCNSGTITGKPFNNANIGEIALRAIDELAMTEIFNNDLSEFIKINDMLNQLKENGVTTPIYNYDYDLRQRTTKRLKSFESIIINPAPDVLGDTMLANQKLISERLAHGRQKAAEAVNSFLKHSAETTVVSGKTAPANFTVT